MSRQSAGEVRLGTARASKGGRVAAVLLAALALATGGCATTRALLPTRGEGVLPPDSPVASRTLDPHDAWLRHYLLRQEPASALEYLRGEGEPRIPDDLLRSLQEAIVARSAGDFVASNALLEAGEVEIERRKVLSVSQTAGSYLINDRVLSYLPATGERAMVPYYRMMNYMALGEPQNAAVEARRITALIDRATPLELGGCREAAMLNYASGIVFEVAGELNDALVSLRRAEATLSGCGTTSPDAAPDLPRDISRIAGALGIDELVDSTTSRFLGSSSSFQAVGEVLVLVEHGFIAHRAEGAIHVPIYEDELEELDGADGERIAEVAGVVTARLLLNFSERGYYGASWDDSPAVQVGHALGGAHIIRLAWPELRGAVREPAELRVLAADDTVSAPAFSDLSGAARQALNAERVATLARLVSRGITKFLAARAVENKAEKQGGELVGFLAGRLSNLAVNATERADTRSWTLLPAQVSLARLTLPAGEHEVTIQSYNPRTGSWSDVDLRRVTVEAGRVAVVSRRVWDDGAVEDADEAEMPGGWYPLNVAEGNLPDPADFVAAAVSDSADAPSSSSQNDNDLEDDPAAPTAGDRAVASDSPAELVTGGPGGADAPLVATHPAPAADRPHTPSAEPETAATLPVGLPTTQIGDRGTGEGVKADDSAREVPASRGDRAPSASEAELFVPVAPAAPSGSSAAPPSEPRARVAIPVVQAQ